MGGTGNTAGKTAEQYEQAIERALSENAELNATIELLASKLIASSAAIINSKSLTDCCVDLRETTDKRMEALESEADEAASQSKLVIEKLTSERNELKELLRSANNEELNASAKVNELQSLLKSAERKHEAQLSRISSEKKELELTMDMLAEQTVDCRSKCNAALRKHVEDEKRLSEFETSIAELERKNALLAQQLASSQSDRAQLHQQVTTLQGERCGAAEGAGESDESPLAVALLESSGPEQSEEIEVLATTSNDLAIERDRLSEENADLAEQLADAKSQISSHEATIGENEAKILSLSDEVSALISWKEAMAVKKREVDDLTAVLVEHKEQKNSLIEQNASLTSSLSDAKEENNSIQERLDSSVSMQKQLGTRITSLEEENAALIEREMGATKEISELTSQLSVAETDMTDMDDMLSAKHVELETLMQKHSLLVDEKGLLSEQNEALNEQLSSVRLKFNVLEKALREMETEKSCLATSLREANQENEGLTVQVENMRHELESTAATLADVHSMIQVDHREATKMMREIKDLKTKISTLEESLVTERRERDDTSSRLESSRLIEDELRDQLEDSQAMVEAMTTRVEQMTKDVAQLGALRDTSDELSQRLRLKMKRQEESSRDEIQCLESIISSLKKEYGAFKTEMEFALAAQTRHCEAKLEALCGDYLATPQSANSFDDLVALLAREMKRVRSKSDQLSSELERSQDEGIILGQQVLILSKEVSKYKLQSKDMYQALEEFTKTRSRDPNKVVDNDEIKKRLAVFRRKIEAGDGVVGTEPVVINEK